MDHNFLAEYADKASKSYGNARAIREDNLKRFNEMHEEQLAKKAPAEPDPLFNLRYPDGTQHGVLTDMQPGDVAWLDYAKLATTRFRDLDEIEITKKPMLTHDAKVRAELEDGAIIVKLVDAGLGCTDGVKAALAMQRVFVVKYLLGAPFRARIKKFFSERNQARRHLQQAKDIINQRDRKIEVLRRQRDGWQADAKRESGNAEHWRKRVRGRRYFGFLAGCVVSGLIYWLVNSGKLEMLLTYIR